MSGGRVFGVVQGFAVILGIIAAGYLASRSGVVRGEQRFVLNRVAFYVATPALLFGVLQRSDPSVIVSPVIIITGIAAVLAAGLYLLCSRLWFRGDLGSTTLGSATAGYVNSNNLGLPVAIYILGDAAYVAPLILLQVIVFAPVVLALLEATRGNQRGAMVALGRASRNPIIVASVLGVLAAVFEVPIPSLVLDPIVMLGDASIPMVLLSFGISLHGQRALQPGTGRVSVVVASAIKVLVMPAITWAMCVAAGLGPHETFVATTIGALPTAQNVYNYAATYRCAEIQVRDTVVVTTFASLPVIALIAALLA